MNDDYQDLPPLRMGLGLSGKYARLCRDQSYSNSRVIELFILIGSQWSSSTRFV